MNSRLRRARQSSFSLKWSDVYAHSLAMLFGLILLNIGGVGIYEYVMGNDPNFGPLDQPVIEIIQKTKLFGSLVSIACVLVIIINVKKLLEYVVGMRTFLAIYGFVLVTSIYSTAFLSTFWLIIKGIVYLTALYAILKNVKLPLLVSYLSGMSALVVAASIAMAWNNVEFRVLGTGSDDFVFSGAVRGLFLTKNGFGAYCFWIGNIIVALAWVTYSLRRVVVTFSLAVLLFGLLAANSRTPVIAGGVELIFLFALSVFSRYAKRNVLIPGVLIVFGLAVAMITAYLYPKIASGDLTLTGRTEIWRKTLDFLGDSWILGKGGLSNTDEAVKADLLRKEGVAAIDSSFLVTIFNHGLLGIFVLFAFYAINFLSAYTSKSTRLSNILVASTLVYIVYGVTESGYGLNISLGMTCLFLLNALRMEKFLPPEGVGVKLRISSKRLRKNIKGG